MIIDTLQIIEISNVLEILKQDMLRNCDGNYPEKDWISHFMIEDGCFAYGLYNNNGLVAVLLAERLSYNGCMLWYVAVKPEEQGKGYGSMLFSSFEETVKSKGIEWIFLNSTKNALDFYKKHQFITSEFSTVYEHVKDL